MASTCRGRLRIACPRPSSGRPRNRRGPTDIFRARAVPRSVRWLPRYRLPQARACRIRRRAALRSRLQHAERCPNVTFVQRLQAPCLFSTLIRTALGHADQRRPTPHGFHSIAIAPPKIAVPTEPKAGSPAEPKADSPTEPKADPPTEPKAGSPTEPKADPPTG